MGDPLTEELIYDSAEVRKEEVPFNKVQFFGISLIHLSDLSIMTKMSSLRIIQLRLCNIVAFPEEFFSMPSLETIDLSGNSIASLPQLIPKENSEEEVPDIWQQLPNLITLNLSENSLNELNEIFKIKTLPKLKHLILTGNICLTAYNAFNRICETFPNLLALNESIITSQHRGIIMNLVNYTANSTIPLVDADNYIFLYVKYLKCSVNDRFARRHRAQFFCVNRVLRRFSAATKIQSVFRGFIKRQKWKDINKSAIFLQTRIKFWCYSRSRAAMRIQGLYRCHKLKHVILEHRSARKIQGMYRRYLSRDNAIIGLFEISENTYRFYITNESLIELYKFLESKEISYSKSIINNSMLVEEDDEFKVIRFGPLKKRNLPGSPSIYFNVDENVLIRRNRNHEPNDNSIWCNHDHNNLPQIKQVSKNGVNYTPTCPFSQIKYIPYTREIQYKKLPKYQMLKKVTFTDVPLFRKIIKLVAHSFPEGVVLFPYMSLNESASQFTLHCSFRMFIVRNKKFHQMKKYTIEKRAAKCIKGFVRTRRITRTLSHFAKLLRYSDLIPEAMTFFVPQKFLNIVKLDFKNQNDLIQYESENNGQNVNYTFKTEKTVSTHLMHSDTINKSKSNYLAESTKGNNKENGFRSRMKKLQKSDNKDDDDFYSLYNEDNDNSNDNDSQGFVDNYDPNLKHGFPVKFPAVYGFSKEKWVSLPPENPNPFLELFIPTDRIIFTGKSLSMLPTFETTIRPALPSMFTVPITKKTIRIGRIMRITFSSPEEAFRRLFIFAYLTGDTSRFMIDTQVVEYCAALLIQNHWRGYLYRRDYRHLGAQKGVVVNPSILLKQEIIEAPQKKEDEPPPTFKKMVRKELPPEVAIANLRGDYRSWESLHRRRTINDLYQFNDKPYKSSILPDESQASNNVNKDEIEVKTESMKNLGLVNDLENAYANLSEPRKDEYQNKQLFESKKKAIKSKRDLIELSNSTINGHINEESRKKPQTVVKPPLFEVELETQKIFGPSLPRVKELDLSMNTAGTMKMLSQPKEAIKPIDTSERAYESIKQFYANQISVDRSRQKTGSKFRDKESSQSRADSVFFEEEEEEPSFEENDENALKQKPLSAPFTSTPRTPNSEGRPRVQFEVLKDTKAASQIGKINKQLNSVQPENPAEMTQKVTTPINKKVTPKVKIDVLANTSKAIKKARPDSAIDRSTNRAKKIESIPRPSSKLTTKTPKPLIDLSSDSGSKGPSTPQQPQPQSILKRQDSPQIRVPTPKLQTFHYKSPQMKNSDFTESLAAAATASTTATITPISGSRSQGSAKSDVLNVTPNNSSLSLNNLTSTATLIPNSSLTEFEGIERPFTSLMITSPQWTDNTMKNALRRAFTKLVRLHQIGIQIEQEMVIDNTIAEKRYKAVQAREKVVRALDNMKVTKEVELADLMERNKIEQLEREEKVRQVRAKTALTKTRNVNKVRKIHNDAIIKYKKERDFALNFVSVSRKIAQQIETKQLKAEKRKELEEAQTKVSKQHQEAKEAIEKYKQKVKDMEDYKRKVASRDKLINEEKRELLNDAARRRFELLATIKEDEKLMKEAYHLMKNQKKIVPTTNIPQPLEIDEVQGASMIIKDYMGPNLGEIESHLLCQIISQIV